MNFIRNLLTVLLVALLSPPAFAHGSASMGGFDARFLQQMTDHHGMAIMMAKGCETKAVHAELKELCQKIVTAQSDESERMHAWLKQWSGATHVHQKKASDPQMQKLDRLTGAAYETAFLKQMSHHHEMALQMAKDCPERAEHRELKDLCSGINQTQAQEIQQMRQWSCSWYKECANASK